MSLGSLRLATVLAVRETRRHRRRALAIMITLAVPVAAVTTADVVSRSTHLSQVEQLNRQLGPAQALIQWTGFGSVVQTPDGNEEPTGGPNAGDAASGTTTFQQANKPAPASLPAALLPTGATAVGEADAYPFVVSANGGTDLSVRGVDLRSPAPGAGVRLRAGRLPQAPGEIALSPPVLSQLKVALGDSLRIPGHPLTLRVVGVVADRYSPGDAIGFTLPATAEAVAAASPPVGPTDITGITQWYVSSAPIDWPTVEALNRQGWLVTSRAVLLHPPPASAVPADQQPDAYRFAEPSTNNQTAEVGAGLLGAMLLLEVILLAGPAFAVGARRRRHELAVIAASGGSRRQLVGFVVADGIILGVIAAAGGAVIGIGAGAAVLAGLRKWTDRVPGPVTLRGWEIAGIAALAIVSGMLAALLPALSASKADTAQTLRGHQSAAPLSWRPAIAGAAAMAAAAGLAAADLDEFSNRGVPVPLVLAAVLAEVGLVLLTPGILVLIGRSARRLGLWPRLAVRDAARNRNAASPALAAIIAVVAAATTVLIYGSSIAAHDHVTYLPSLPVGDATVNLEAQTGFSVDATAAVAAVRAHFPGADVLELDGPGDDNRQVVLLPPATSGCPTPQIQFQGGGAGGLSYASNCAQPDFGGESSSGSFLVDDGQSMAALLPGPSGALAAAALRSEKVVVFQPSYVAGGMITVALGPGQPSTAHLPAIAIDWPGPLSASPADLIVPPSMLARLGLDSGPDEIYIKHASSQPSRQLAAANLALERLGIDGLSIQGPYHNGISPALLAVTAADVFLTMAAAVVATALVSIDAAEDLRILAAIGAAPRGQRRLAVTRAALICGVGTVLGILAGLIPGIGLIWRLRHQEGSNLGGTPNPYPLSLPWAHLLAIAVIAPLLAAATGAVISGPRLPAETLSRNSRPSALLPGP